MSIQDAARRLGISAQAVYKRIAAGTLAARKINGSWSVDAASVESALAGAPRPGRPRKGEQYVLMNKGYAVMEFSYDQAMQRFLPREVFDASRAPIGTVTRRGRGSAEGLRRWWEHRSIPQARSGMDAKLAELGLDDPSAIPFRNLGFSLSDQYWVMPAGESLRWEDLNCFDNDFGRGEGTWDSWLSDVGLSSPDNTSEGVLPKKWVCEGARRVLLKGHIPWTDQQVYNEIVATALHARLLERGEYVEYEVRDIDGLGAACACLCFVGRDEEYVPASLVLDAEGSRAGESTYDFLLRCCVNLGIPERETRLRLSKMIVCDGLLANTDRHLRNFGFIRNVDTLEWRFAPLFDSGNSLWYDKDESQVARGDYDFIARPFDPKPNRQLMLTAHDQWFDLGLLDGFADEAVTILADGDVSAWRTDYLRAGIEQRIEALRVIWG